MFNRIRAIWSKGYQRRSLGKSHQNGDYVKQAMRKSYLRTGFESAALKRILREDNFLTLLVLCSLCSGRFFLGFRTGSLQPDGT